MSMRYNYFRDLTRGVILVITPANKIPRKPPYMGEFKTAYKIKSVVTDYNEIILNKIKLLHLFNEIYINDLLVYEEEI